MERWGRVIDVAFGLFFYPLSGDIFSRKQTAVFRNTEGDIIGNFNLRMVFTYKTCTVDP